MQNRIIASFLRGGGGLTNAGGLSYASGLSRKSAFTLAEVLITLGIIGIIAAMTLPSLVGKYRSKAASVQLKKMYSVISQAMLRAIPDGDYNNLSFADGGDTNSVLEFFNNYLKPQIKTMNIKSGLYANDFKKFNKKNQSIDCGSGVLSFQTPDGYEFYIDTWKNSDAEVVQNKYGVDLNGISGSIVVVYADVNGQKKPNTLGKDVFVYVLNRKGLQPAGISKNDTEVETECKNTGYYCFTKIMRNGWKVSQDDVY